MKTYSRKRRQTSPESTDTLKRRRVLDQSPIDGRHGATRPISTSRAVSSSAEPTDYASSEAIFSDAVDRASTPPSSPPPCANEFQGTPKNANKENEHLVAGIQPCHTMSPACVSSVEETTSKSAFPISGPHAVPGGPLEMKLAKHKRHEMIRKPKLVQMQINLGPSAQTTCKTCHMTYVPSNGDDAQMHRRFHERNIEGVDVGPKGRRSTNVIRRPAPGDTIVRLHYASNKAWKATAREILNVAQAELGAVDITDETLWGMVWHPQFCEGLDPVLHSACDAPRCNVYLYIRRNKCIGLCLAEWVPEGRQVLEPDVGDTGAFVETGSRADGEPLRVTEEAFPMMAGVSRIWVASGHRKQGIASELLNTVIAPGNGFAGLSSKLPKTSVAFSQPTNSGAKLASDWFGASHGWHVYV